LKTFRYFITGATGLAGSYILKKLIAEKCIVRALKRPTSSLKLVDNLRVDPNATIEWVEGDLGNIHQLSDYIQDIDYVIHCAGLVSFREKDRPRLLKINAEGTANLINVCLESGIKKFCHISSIAALGNSGSSTVTEKDTWDNRNSASVYAVSKHLGEREVWRGIAEGLPAVIVNPSVILGVGNGNQSSGRIFQHILENKNYYPIGELNVVDAEDVANAVFQLLKSDIQGERFILNAQKISYQTLFQNIAQAFGQAPPSFQLNEKMLKFLYFFGKLLKPFGVQTGLNSDTLKRLLDTPSYDGTKIKTQLNFQYTDIQQSITQVCKQYQKMRLG